MVKSILILRNISLYANETIVPRNVLECRDICMTKDKFYVFSPQSLYLILQPLLQHSLSTAMDFGVPGLKTYEAITAVARVRSHIRSCRICC